MTDKFFHGVKFDEYNNDIRLMTLKKIIKSGFLLGPYSQGYHSPYGYGDKIFLSVYPGGKYSSEYNGNGFATDDAFEMTRSSYYFILSSKLKDDYDIQKGNYPHECTVESKIDLYKYMIGIGNPGFRINFRLLGCYYVTKYMNGEISYDDLIKLLQETYYFANTETAIADLIDVLVNPYRKFNFLNRVFDDDEMKIFEKDRYHDLKSVLDEVGINIKLYDNTGYIVDEKMQLERVKYIESYIKDSDYESRKYVEALSRVRKQYKGL